MLIIKKNNNKHLINESVTSLYNIYDYGKTWTTEHTVENFSKMISNFIDGALEGLNINEKVYNDRESKYILFKDKKMIKQIQDIIARGN